ncbi:MAG TPA: hypothetical protein VG815_05695, partial [Chloroflexota bacterium]|nr:hypothetical protein [Chloroflexota bacterium]
MKELPRGARLYWFAVVASAAAVVAFASARAVTSFHEFGVRTWVSVLALVCLAFICERMSIPLLSFEDEAATHSIGSVAGIAAVIVLPWYIAIPLLPVAIAWSQRGRSAVRALFNISHSALSVAAAASVFQLAGGIAALHTTNPASAARSLGVMVAMGVVYYVFGSGLVSAMVGQASGQRVWDVYHANHLNTMLQEATAIGLGLLLGGFWLYNPAFTPFVGLPVVMAYFSIETFVRI